MKIALARLSAVSIFVVGYTLVAASPALAMATPSVMPTASGATTVGLQIFENVNLSGGTSPSGTVTFSLFGPGQTGCTSPIFTSAVAVTGAGSYNSAHFTTRQAGTYQWQVAYGGDVNNNPVGPTSCTDPGSSVIVGQASTGLSATASPSVAVGGAVHDTATLGGFSPTGTITFRLSGPTDTFCGANPIFTASVPVNAGAGSYTSPSFAPTAPGTYRWQAGYSGDVNNQPVNRTSCLDPNESVTVTQGSATPTISTTASAAAAVGGSVTDSATLAGGNSPTGTVTFTLYGPNDTTCSATPAFNSTSSVTANATYTSGAYTATAAGTYRFTAAYSGDTNNTAAATACNAANQNVTVTRSTPTIATTASPATTVGNAITATATLAGATTPTGTITFNAYGPNNTTCNGTASFSTTKAVNGNGSYTSGPDITTAAGTYRFTAAYSGDTNNNPAGPTACADPAAAVTVTAANTTVATHASNPVAVGGAITATATIAGGFNPNGTITFSLYGPNNTTCNAPAAFTSAVSVTGNGPYTSAAFTANTAGTYRFTAAYSGDTNNNPAATACNAANANVAVTTAAATLTAAASPSLPAGGAITDTATIAGATTPTGTVTFTLYGPNDTTCSATPAFNSTSSVTANATYTSGAYTATAAGTYRFTAAYSGDTNNTAAATACNAANQNVTVTRSTPTIATTASPATTVGNAITATATLAGATTPTGTITFNAYGPNNTTCNGTASFSTTKAVNGNGSYTSGPDITTAAGTYRFTAAYSGDTNNNPAGPTACADPAAAVTVTAANTTVATHASNPVAVGGAITATATIAGGFNPNGTITFSLYGPNNTTCNAPAAFTSAVSVTGNGPYTSAAFTANTAGTYRFTAAYSGDTNNNPAATACNAANANVAVTTAAATLTAAASPSLPAGGAITDTATIAGATTPTGTVTFTLYGPNDTTCSATPAFNSTSSVTANATYTSGAYTATAAGTYRFTAAYSGDTNNTAAATACNAANQNVTVTRSTPTIATTASPATTVGNAITATATLAGATTPTGTITFNAYGPNNTTCNGTASFSTTKAVNGNGSYTSGPDITTAAGTYRFTAAYSGDTNNNPAGPTACADPAAAVTVTAANTTVATHASNPVAVGGAITATATIAGGFNPNGTITFSLYGPNNTTCNAPAAFTSAVSVTGNGPYTSAAFTANTAGTYRFTAAYSGDTNNNPAATACNAANANVAVTTAAATLTAAASPSLPAGGAITDTATIAGATTPTGTVTFTLYGPNDTTCSATPAFNSTSSVTANATYTSGAYTATAAGTYRFTAAYSGDTNNTAAATACNAANQNVTVTRSTPTIATTASPATTVGNAITATATLAGATTPTGTITFNAYGPNNTTCNGTASFSTTKAVNGNGPYTSDPYVPTLPGAYRFQASYSGDANNAAIASTACDAPAQVVTVSAASATVAITTSANPSVFGQAVTFTMTVVGGDGGGSVTFYADASTTALTGCAAVPLTSVGGPPHAGCDSAVLTTGQHSVTASYSGDAATVAATATLVGGQTVNEGPSITSGAYAGFIVGVAGSFTVTATGTPPPTLTAAGALPAGITFNTATATFNGTAAQNTKGNYPITVTATNNTAATTQNLTVTVNQATLTYPADGQTNTDTTVPFTWTPLPQAQGYYLIVGTTLYGADLLNSGILPPTQTTLNAAALNTAALPAATTLHATLYSEINNTWTSYQATTFNAAANQGTLTYPTNNQTNTDPTHPFTWTPTPHAQGYYLTIGTTANANNLLNSGIIAATQTSYPTPILPAHQTLYATLYSAINGTWQPQNITFTTTAAAATITTPTPGQTVTTPTTITWNTITQAQGYYLTIGTTAYGNDLTASGVLPPTQTTLTTTTLPKNTTLYTTLYTAINGTWTGIQTTTFTAA